MSSFSSDCFTIGCVCAGCAFRRAYDKRPADCKVPDCGNCEPDYPLDYEHHEGSNFEHGGISQCNCKEDDGFER